MIFKDAVRIHLKTDQNVMYEDAAEKILKDSPIKQRKFVKCEMYPSDFEVHHKKFEIKIKFKNSLRQN